MTPAEKLFIETGLGLKKAEQHQLFGKPCFSIGGKAFCCFFDDCMVFKLPEGVHEKAMHVKGAKLFDPSGKKRPMKEWVQVPYSGKAGWSVWAAAAMKYAIS